ncbi:MAG TPA: hypothetical protein VFE50_11690 [Cyclobacteriaceae bacterium]|nr:hypothetical protein [Cyclobacteriaceae bacterium]
MRIFFFAFIFLAACAAPSSETKETKFDSVAVAPLEETRQETLTATPEEDNKPITSSFTEPQLQTDVAYVYRLAGLAVYASLEEAGDTTKAISLMPYGYKIKLTEPLVNNQRSDNITYEGFKGRYINAQMPDGTVRFIFSGYLTNFPVPKEMEGPVEYFLARFHLVDTPAKWKSEDQEMKSWSMTYQFESDIKVFDHGYYEGGGTDITLPATCTLQEGFLLLGSFSYLAQRFPKYFPSYPTGEIKDRIDEFYARTVEVDNTGVLSINLSDESGCYEDIYVKKVEERLVIGNDGGC